MVATDDERSRIARSQKGDHEAFELLVREHQRMIHSLCYRMTGSPADAEDLAQETFIHAYQHLEGFRGEARFSSWLYRIAINQCLNWRTAERRRELLHTNWGAQVSPQSRVPSPQSSPASGEQIQDALMKLKPKQRAALVLTACDGMTHAEAARVLGCSETTISWRIFAARGKLKRILENLERPDV